MIVIDSTIARGIILGLTNLMFFLALLETNFHFKDISSYTEYWMVVFFVFQFMLEPLFNYRIYLMHV